MARSPPWRIIPRPLLETILNNHAHHHRVPQPLLLHGPRGSGKSSLILHRLLPQWSSSPHHTAFVDFSSSPSWSLISSNAAALPSLQSLLESSLETLTLTAIRLGAISSHDILTALQKSHGISTALRRIAGKDGKSDLKLWHKAVFDRIRIRGMKMVGRGGGGGEVAVVKEDVAFVKEGMAALEVAKEVIEMEREWRKEAVRRMNARGVVARSLVSSATDWPILLVELLSQAAEVDFFQVYLRGCSSGNPSS